MIVLTQQQQDKQADRTCPECRHPKSRPLGEFSQLHGWRYGCPECNYTFWVGLLQVVI